MPKIVNQSERRAVVAAAARRVIARDGLDGAGVRQVAAEAGSSTTVVTHYFASKQALIEAAIEDAYAAVERRMVEQLQAGPVGLAALRLVLLEALPLDAERRDEARVWMAFWAAAATRPELRRVQREGYRAWRGLVAGVLADAESRGEIATGLDAVREGEQLLCLMDGLMMQATLEPRRFTVKRQVGILDSALARLASG